MTAPTKNKLEHYGIITFIVVIGFAFFASLYLAGCSDGGDPNPNPNPDPGTANQTPTAADYDVSNNLSQIAGSVTAVTVAPKTGKSTGAITVKYGNSTAIPQAVGSYALTFDVAAAAGWNAANGLSAGTLTVTAQAQNAQTPSADDFTVSGTGSFAYDGSPKTVTVTPKTGKSGGTVSIKYSGSTTPPSAVGSYAVTFDVAAVYGWNAANGLTAGTLTINKATPTANDFTVSGTGTFTYDNTPKSVTVTRKDGKSTGTITVKYNNSATPPTTAGTYTVTFDVTADANWNEANGLTAGNLTITPIAVTLNTATANGSTTLTTSVLTLTFDKAISGLTANDITLSGVNGVSKGTLSGSGPTYTLPISGFTAGGTLTITAAKTNYTVSGSKQVTIYYSTAVIMWWGHFYDPYDPNDPQNDLLWAETQPDGHPQLKSKEITSAGTTIAFQGAGYRAIMTPKSLGQLTGIKDAIGNNTISNWVLFEVTYLGTNYYAYVGKVSSADNSPTQAVLVY